jgi:carbonic anhydrase/acetyltransferase-like protein (isoleucine patch superfamily)
VHGCRIEDGCLIGIGAIVLNGARIGEGSVVAAASLVPERVEIPPRSMVIGAPARVKRQVTKEERARFQSNGAHYVRLGRVYKKELP